MPPAGLSCAWSWFLLASSFTLFLISVALCFYVQGALQLCQSFRESYALHYVLHSFLPVDVPLASRFLLFFISVQSLPHPKSLASREVEIHSVAGYLVSRLRPESSSPESSSALLEQQSGLTCRRCWGRWPSLASCMYKFSSSCKLEAS